MAPIHGNNLTLEEAARDSLQDVGSLESSALMVLFLTAHSRVVHPHSLLLSAFKP